MTPLPMQPGRLVAITHTSHIVVQVERIKLQKDLFGDMKIYIDLLMVAVITIYIVDLSGFTETLLKVISAYKGRKITELKPFTCSLCMVWWVCLIYAVIVGNLTIPVVALIALLSLLSVPCGQFLILIRDAFLKVINKLMDLL